MNNPVTAELFKGAFERSLTSDEDRVLPAWLNTAWRTLQREVPGIPARLALPSDAAGRLDLDEVRDVVIAITERKVRNPSGTAAYGADDYNERLDPVMSTGQFYVTDAELAKLAPRDEGVQGIYSIPLGAS